MNKCIIDSPHCGTPTNRYGVKQGVLDVSSTCPRLALLERELRDRGEKRKKKRRRRRRGEEWVEKMNISKEKEGINKEKERGERRR